MVWVEAVRVEAVRVEAVRVEAVRTATEDVSIAESGFRRPGKDLELGGGEEPVACWYGPMGRQVALRGVTIQSGSPRNALSRAMPC